MTFSRSSKARLTRHDLDRFPGATLFDRLARAVCGAGCLPRKELFEAWEMAKRVRRHLSGGRVIDIGGGHGLLAHALLLLDDSSPAALVVDPATPLSARTVHEAVTAAWPRLGGRVEFRAAGLDDIDVDTGDLIVSSHACGALTDRVLDRAIGASVPVAVLPCCHDLAAADATAVAGWTDGALGIDIARALRLRGAGYRVWTTTIPVDITPKNRLLVGAPGGRPA